MSPCIVQRGRQLESMEESKVFMKGPYEMFMTKPLQHSNITGFFFPEKIDRVFLRQEPDAE